MRHVPRRLAVVLTLTALSGAAGVADPAWGQAAPSDSGGADRGESASAWHDVLSFLGWILLAVVVFGLLLWMVLGRRREGAPPDAPEAAAPAEGSPPPLAPPRAEASPPPLAPPPAASPPPPRRGAGQDARELAVLTFDHIEGAERAYADARGRANDAPWLREVVFVECHRRGRIVVRGTFAGHYLDVDDVADAIGHDTAVGAAAGALVGLAFGPPGFAVGLGRRRHRRWRPRDRRPHSRGEWGAVRRDPPRHPRGVVGDRGPGERGRQRGAHRGAPRTRRPPDPPPAVGRRGGRAAGRGRPGAAGGDAQHVSAGALNTGDRRVLREARTEAVVVLALDVALLGRPRVVDKAKSWGILNLPWWAWLLLAAPALVLMRCCSSRPLAGLSPGRVRNAGIALLGTPGRLRRGGRRRAPRRAGEQQHREPQRRRPPRPWHGRLAHEHHHLRAAVLAARRGRPAPARRARAGDPDFGFPQDAVPAPVGVRA